MNFRRDTEPDEPEINFVPLIDLLLVILIFMFVTTTFSKFTQLKVELPSASKEESSAPEEIVVEVSASGQYRLLGSGTEPSAALSSSALSSALARMASTAKTPMVVIYADGGASHQSVIAVLDAARLAGLEKVTFAAEGESASQ